MIQVHVVRKGKEVREVPVAELSQVRAEPQTLVWVDLVSATAEELAAMGEEFQVHELALASCAVGSKQRPRVEEFEGQVLLIAYASKPVPEGEPVDLRELDVIAGHNFLLTFHGGVPVDAETVAGRITARPELAKHGAGFLLYVVLDELVDTFFPTLDHDQRHLRDELPAHAGTGRAVRLRLGARADGGVRRQPVGLFQAQRLAVENTGMDDTLAQVQARVAERFPAAWSGSAPTSRCRR